MSKNGSHTGPPRLEVVHDPSLPTGSFDREDPTDPNADVAVSVAVLYRLFKRMNARMGLMAAGMVMMAGSLGIVAWLIWWTRPR